MDISGITLRYTRHTSVGGCGYGLEWTLNQAHPSQRKSARA